MRNTDDPIPAAGALPEAYHEVLYWRVTEKPNRLFFVQALALVSFVLFGLLFAILAISLGKLPLSGSFTIGLRESGALLIGVVLTLVAHELTHGLAMRLAGATPRYGIFWKGMMLYATSPGYAYQRTTYVTIMLAPFALISALAVLGIWLVPGSQWATLFVICGAVNASGAIGDLWMTRIALRYPTTARIMDERDGMRVFVPDGPPAERMSRKDPMEQESQRRPAKENPMSVGIAIGMMLGLALGVALNNLAVGLALGVAIGAAIGTSLDQKRKRSDSANHDERQEDRPS
ncbi:DUF3267 domain-containing protein [Chloroflexales bacterium ZM16-3]|nr:DUF3267 domain-containing protein [Chloroflexales bacterium ZM16-3]